MVVIGLTGSIGTGKSTVSGMLARLGAYIIDADALVKELQQPGSPILAEIEREFGNVFTSPGILDRSKLADIVFRDPEKLKRLNEVIHPRVIERTKQLLQNYRRQNPRGVAVIDAPLLLEAGMDKLVDEVWVVACDEETQIKRVMERDKLGREEVLRRIRAQMPLNEKIRRAHRVIWTDVPLPETERQIRNAYEQVAGGVRSWQQGGGY